MAGYIFGLNFFHRPALQERRALLSQTPLLLLPPSIPLWFRETQIRTKG
jgi:hypothetical protein